MKKLLQIASDLHIEYYSFDVDKFVLEQFIKPSAPNLALCGDIGYPCHPSYRTLIEQCSLRFEKVFVITGNHEYYQNMNNVNSVIGDVKLTMNEVDELIRKITSEFKNVYFLQNSVVELYDKVILGTTLWTNIPNKDVMNVTNYMNDYVYMYKKNDKFVSLAQGADPSNKARFGEHTNKIKVVSVEDTIMLWKKNVEWLEKSIEENKGKDIIVLTHHLPSFKLITPKYKNSNFNSAFATDLEYLMKDNVKYWICGHTHSNIECIVGKTHCIASPYGYINENMERRVDYVIDLDK